MKCDECGHEHYQHGTIACLDECKCNNEKFHHVELVDDNKYNPKKRIRTRGRYAYE